MALHKLEPGKTLVWTLPGYDKNEAEIAEMLQLLWDIVKDVGIDREMMWDKKIMFKGDWLIVCNIVYQSSLITTHYSLAIKLQSESSFGAQLDHIEPVPGLFHFQMAILNLLFRAHRLLDDDFGSLMSWIRAINRNTGMWNFKANTIKDFRACDSFFNHLVDAHVLAAIGGTLDATT